MRNRVVRPDRGGTSPNNRRANAHKKNDISFGIFPKWHFYTRDPNITIGEWISIQNRKHCVGMRSFVVACNSLWYWLTNMCRWGWKVLSYARVFVTHTNRDYSKLACSLSDFQMTVICHKLWTLYNVETKSIILVLLDLKQSTNYAFVQSILKIC